MKIVECKRCLNNSTVKHFHVNEEGLCNYCLSYEQMKPILNDKVKLQELFLQRIAKIRGKYSYDVAVGFSGGKDSTYILYKLVKEYKLHIKAFTLDNGFLSAEAKQKIDAIVKELAVEHEYVYCDQALLKKIYQTIVKKYLSPCIACSYLGYTVMINYASKINAGACIHGRSKPQMFRNFALDVDDPFKQFIFEGLKDPAEVDLANLYKNALMKVGNLIDRKLSKEMQELLLTDTQKYGFREFIAYFLYHDYDVNDVVKTIEQNTSWKQQTVIEHFDCEIHNAATYLKNIIARRPHILPEVSYLVRVNKLTKAEGRELLNKQKIAYPKAEFAKMCQYMHLNKQLILLKAKIYSKRWW